MANEHFEDAQLVPLSAKEEPLSNKSLTKLGDFTDMEGMISYAKSLLVSNLIPKSLRTPEAVVAVILMGKEMGFEPMTSLTQLHNIQGRVTMSVHAMGAKIRQAGVAWSTIENFAPVFSLKEGEKDKVVDYQTVIEFYRPFQGKLLTERVSFSWQEAKKMGLAEKENWTKMPKVMLWSRCFSIGARRVAPDALLGMYETAEWAEVAGVKHTVDNEGEVTLVD